MCNWTIVMCSSCLFDLAGYIVRQDTMPHATNASLLYSRASLQSSQSPRTWTFYFEPGRYITINRTQFPLMPLESVSLYSMQGTTADPGLYAYWAFPSQCSEVVRWLIVYVLLSRPRALDKLKSINLDKKIRELIESSSRSGANV